ncbi:short-chain dehydrogenase [Pokkaliibacter plantistimulans]|uniref:Short-chain dehydrogenase n=1 Tax=Proteobacteria bacterium 228 TaxID=2083153 RepID=A0A2S5KRW3_9PROT|nr:SDR family NAD(P)-dependent oxidoreductase [Pokkaliibacter plantistimulans]PPC77597.1 short-chain dehydrogenase [Pokkaliibacter plantistimulans]
MARIFITGATDGLGLATANSLLDNGHEVIVHGRHQQRINDIQCLLEKGANPVIGDLSITEQQISVAKQVNNFGQLDAVIHNAGTLSGKDVFAVNVVAPYVLSALITKPSRLIYLSSSMHFGGKATVSSIGCFNHSYNYSDSKLLVTTLASALARRWLEVSCYSVDPGWVPTKMGGKDAPDDLVKGYETQEWLATTQDTAMLKSGTYWHHKQMLAPHRASQDEVFQEALLTELEQITGISLS